MRSPVYSISRVRFGISVSAKTPRPWIAERRTANRRGVLRIDGCTSNQSLRRLGNRAGWLLLYLILGELESIFAVADRLFVIPSGAKNLS